MIEPFDGLGIIGDHLPSFRDACVGAGDEVAGKHLRCFHRPKLRSIEGTQPAALMVDLDRVGDPMCEGDCALPTHDLVQRDQLLRTNKGARAIVDEDVFDVVRQGVEGARNRVLAFRSPLDEEGGRRGVGGQLDRLGRVPIDDDVKISDAALHECACGMGKGGLAADGGKDLVSHGTLHAIAAASGEKYGGVATHVTV